MSLFTFNIFSWTLKKQLIPLIDRNKVKTQFAKPSPAPIHLFVKFNILSADFYKFQKLDQRLNFLSSIIRTKLKKNFGWVDSFNISWTRCKNYRTSLRIYLSICLLNSGLKFCLYRYHICLLSSTERKTLFFLQRIHFDIEQIIGLTYSWEITHSLLDCSFL